MNTKSLRSCILFFCFLVILQSTCIFAQTVSKNSFLNSLQFPQNDSRKSADGRTTVTIVMLASDVGRLFPADLKNRVVDGYKVLVTDGAEKFLGTLIPCGQSTLGINPPNLRIDDLEQIPSGANSRGTKQRPSLAGVPLIDKSIVINPMTMDDGYASTLAYMEFVNHFYLIPAGTEPQAGEFAKVVYRFVDPKDQWTEVINPADGKKINSVNAGLHLVSFNVVKLLRNAQSDGSEVLGIAKAGYNIQNLDDKFRKLLGKPYAEDLEKVFRSADVKNVQVAPFRVKFIWIEKTKAEKESTDPKLEHGNQALMKKLVLQVYSAPKKFKGKELYNNLVDAMDLHQMFRFMALNRLIENGDISDEYFWYVLKDGKTGKIRLGILPLDGDDMLKGVHMFLSTPKQIGVILKGSGIGKKLGMDPGYIINYEDPLFRIIREDPYLCCQYLEEFKNLAGEAVKPGVLDGILGKTISKIQPYSADHEVLDRGLTDERKREYTSTSFADANSNIKKRFIENAVKALAKLNGIGGKPGDLQKAKKGAESKE